MISSTPHTKEVHRTRQTGAKSAFNRTDLQRLQHGYQSIVGIEFNKDDNDRVSVHAGNDFSDP